MSISDKVLIDGASAGDYHFDELRVGGSFAEVALIPEATFARPPDSRPEPAPFHRRTI